jgi:hypothetical protein
VPSGPYARKVVTSPHGDPVLVDYCASFGTAYLKPLGFAVHAEGLQFPPGCQFGLQTGKTEQVAMYLAIDDPATEKSSYGTHQTATVGGLTVQKYPLDKSTGSCTRIVQTSTFNAIIEGIHSAVATSSPLMCQVADLSVARFVQVNAEASLPALPLPKPTATDLDLCKVARATSKSVIPNFGTPTYGSSSFGLTCSVFSNRYGFTIDVARSNLFGHVYDKTTPVGSHKQLQASNTNSKNDCEFAEIGPRIGSSGIHEEVDIDVKARVGSTSFCTQAAKLAGALLDTAGIK